MYGKPAWFWLVQRYGNVEQDLPVRILEGALAEMLWGALARGRWRWSFIMVIKYLVECALHGHQEAFAATEVRCFNQRSGLRPVPEREPKIYCTTCRSLYEARREWTPSDLRLVSCSVACIKCVRTQHRWVLQNSTAH